MAEHKLDRDYNGKTMLRTWWPKVDFNFASIYAWLMGHFNGTADRHKAEHIDYDSSATVKQKIDKEISDRQSGDNALQTKLNTEITNRQNADSEIDGKIAAEVTNRQNADSEIDGKIGDLSELNTSDKSNIVNAVNIIIEALGGAGGTVPIYNYGNTDIRLNDDRLKKFGYHFWTLHPSEEPYIPKELEGKESSFHAVIWTVSQTSNPSPNVLYFDEVKQTLFVFDPKGDTRKTWERYCYLINDEDIEYTEWIEIKAFSGSYNDLSDTPTNATTSTDGFMSAADKAKLDGVLTGTASGDDAIALGGTGGTASGEKSAVIGGYNNNANGLRAFIGGGYQNQAGGNGAAVVGGNNNQANGMRAFVGGGEENHANGDRAAIIGGINNNALGYQFKLGQYSKDGTAGLLGSTSGDAFIIGNGNATARSNAVRVTYAGDIYAAKSINGTGADYAELREWQDGNPNNQDRCGLMVTLVGAKIRIAQPGDNIKKVGVISGNPCIIGNNYADAWHGKYKRDVFGRYVKELVHHDAVVDEVGNIIHDATDAYDFVLADDFDPTQNDNYVSREERPEFDFMGTHGEIVTIDDGTCEADGYCVPGQDGIATKDNDEVGFYVMERVDENHIRVFIR